ncbi:MAG: phosphoglycerate kinase [Candidatus Margulisiibacteriota bacterium]
MKHVRTVNDLQASDLSGKRVLLRADLNVPMDTNGVITDDSRIVAILPTISYLLDHGASVIVVSHLGRPKGQVTDRLRLTPVALDLSEKLNRPVIKTDDCVGSEVEAVCSQLKAGDVVLLENVRFYKEEEANDPSFSKKLARLADIYVNDAFGTAHRAHASTAGVASYLPAYAGFLIQKEVEHLESVLLNPDHPFVAIIGGSKVSSNIGILSHLIGKVDTLLIGGGMMFTFYKAMGYETGRSLVESDCVGLAKDLLEKARTTSTTIVIPSDVVVADACQAGVATLTVPATQIPRDKMGLDIGPDTVAAFSREIAKAKTILWNGPLGVFEIDAFSHGTMAIAKAVADASAKSVIGGGDSAAAIQKAGLASYISHISTGGGASLEFLEGKTLPGIAILKD